MAELVRVDKQQGVAIVTIDNPPLNVMSKKVAEELGHIFKELAVDEEVVTVLLTGAGEKAFMAGADIKEFPQLMTNPEMKNSVMNSHSILNQIDQFNKPTIAVLNGMTFGGGCELALTCDIRIAEEHALVGLPEIKLGLFPGGGGTQRLPRLIGEARAKQLMYTGEPITAEKAERIGLINEVVPTGEGLNYGLKMATQISRHSLQALSRIKKAVDEGLELTLEDGIEREADLFTEVFRTEDIREGVTAFIEKRKPVFTHK
ncbi:enoyl-CoA hydratase/carnithine racemase [Bacillus mesophilus]|uniref:Enoyl-CoA hydratase n=1 Tax=Bacillus mesophilus TaxID=1808955 RepID=A0A6M0Q2F3_9BACI|nr:enoyl-CoA hydratase [Bacillus mesophilus]MBM7659597.1 enoyl-CoA hydratase/carnithine racemase [Bacillus mesophilus]NEY70467.1 enoyl-CoA hydratase [Bacillus mesophilus]